MVAAGEDTTEKMEEVTGAAELVAKAGVDVTEEEEGVGLTTEEKEVGLIMVGDQGVEAEARSIEGEAEAAATDGKDAMVRTSIHTPAGHTGGVTRGSLPTLRGS